MIIKSLNTTKLLVFLKEQRTELVSLLCKLRQSVMKTLLVTTVADSLLEEPDC